MKKRYPFRLGTTSYIIPDEILPNARYLAPLVDDIELVLFEVDDGYNNLPDQSVINELNTIARGDDLTYTVHMPVDLNFLGDQNSLNTTLAKAKRTIDHTLALNAWAYVLHLDGPELLLPSPPLSKQQWQEKALNFVAHLSKWLGDSTLLAVENLENYPLDLWDDVIRLAGTSRCIDIGHLWLNNHPPVPYLERRLRETRVIHIHGIDERDHSSLRHVPKAQLEEVFNELIRQNYQSVITIEVFNQEDFFSSRDIIQEFFDNQRS
jgi:sugar phosphate isomerase/epimerase